MPSSHTDPQALRRASRSSDQSMFRASDSPVSVSMVPRPRARWATRVLVPFALLLATGCVVAYAARDALQPRLAVHVAAAIPKTGALPASGQVQTLEAASDHDNPADAPLGPVAVQAPGWIEPAPFAVTVPALAEGVVKAVLVLEGETVVEGQVVARLIDDDARLLLRSIEAEVAERAADVERAARALATAESQVPIERIAAEELRDEVTRKRELVGAGGVAVGEFRRMEIRLQGLEAKVEFAERQVGEARASLAQAEAARDTALVAKDEALLRLSRMEVRSPVAGVVLARLVEPGSRISMSGKGGEGGPSGSMSGVILRLYEPAHLQVRVDVPLADAAKVGVGTRAIVTTEALADQSFTGVVSRVVHEANIQRNTVQFKVALDAPSPVLKPEMLTRVKLHGPATRNSGRSSHTSGIADGGSDAGGWVALLVPTSAVASVGEDKGRVWIVDASGGSPVARLRDVNIAPAADEGYVTVTSGLQLTDRVILDAPEPPAIKDGTRLRVLGERTTAGSEPASTTP